MNEVMLTVCGNVVSEPTLRTTSTGDVFVTFRVAVNERKRSKDGSWVPGESQYFSVSAFRVLASNAYASIERGQLVTVTGRLRISQYEDKDGQQRTSVQIDAHDVAASMKFARVTATSSTRVSVPSADRLADQNVSLAMREAEGGDATEAVPGSTEHSEGRLDPDATGGEFGPAGAEGSTQGDLVAA